jgi:hypothetical protein
VAERDASSGRSRWRRRIAVALPAAAVLVVLCVAGAGCLEDWREEERCRALAGDVEGLGGIDWDNGFSGSGPQWLNAFTDGVQQATPASRVRIAEALADDEDGYSAFRSALPPDDRDAADRLHTLLLDPEDAAARADDIEVGRDVDAIHRASGECGMV